MDMKTIIYATMLAVCIGSVMAVPELVFDFKFDNNSTAGENATRFYDSTGHGFGGNLTNFCSPHICDPMIYNPPEFLYPVYTSDGFNNGGLYYPTDWDGISYYSGKFQGNTQNITPYLINSDGITLCIRIKLSNDTIFDDSTERFEIETNDGNLYMEIYASSVQFYVYTNSGESDAIADVILIKDKWYLICGAYQKSVAQSSVIIDGIDMTNYSNSDTFNGTPGENYYPPYDFVSFSSIGDISNYGVFNFTVDDIQLYNKPLNITQIINLNNTGNINSLTSPTITPTPSGGGSNSNGGLSYINLPYTDDNNKQAKISRSLLGWLLIIIFGLWFLIDKKHKLWKLIPVGIGVVLVFYVQYIPQFIVNAIGV